MNVSTAHPSVDGSLAAGQKLPVGHVLTDPRLRYWLPPNHANTDLIIASGRPIPFGHPSIDKYMCKHNCLVPVSRFHPSIEEAMEEGEKLPIGHP